MMDERPFKEKLPKPTAELLKKALKSAFKWYEELTVQTTRFKQEWNFSKGSGWIQKVSDSKKALFYFIPLHGSYKISLTMREKEREQLLSDEALKSIHPMMLAAKKYPEGYAMQFTVQNGDDAKSCNTLINKLIALR